jgi:hypothetical protein
MATSCISGSTSRRRAAGVALVALIAACATLPRPKPPEVVSVAVRNIEVRLPTFRVDVELGLRNPNAVDIAIASLAADLDIAGERAGTVRLAAPVTLAAGATIPVELQAVGDAAVTLAGMGRALGSGKPLDYAMRGTLALADGTLYPFSRRGQVESPTMRR